MFGLDTTLTIFLIICIVAAMAFEFINGFHDTANAVATVIYTHSLKPSVAVVWSGLWNFIGVYVGGIAVAMGIVNLLPLDMLIDQNVYHSIAMILALILTAIIWNLGTWYFGIPCSSSHTLIGSIFGVGIAYSYLPEAANVALNWGKVKDVGLSLLISPLIGFGLALGLMFLLKKLVKNKSMFKEPDTDNPPPLLMRAILVLTCTTVSFSHGSNDGQKGVGLIMIILIGIIPLQFAINKADSPIKLMEHVNKIELSLSHANMSKFNDDATYNYSQIKKNLDTIQFTIKGQTTFNTLKSKQLVLIRKSILTTSKKYEALVETPGVFSDDEKKALKSEIKGLKSYTEYAPWWVILIISLSLGIGTMVGWKKIVITIGEKIGKTHLSYAQGAIAQVIATATIGMSTWFGLPVSTTHVLSSGIAGTMVAKKKKNLRMKTIRNIAIAWVVTIPVTILLSAGLFLLLRLILK
jgi:PiT family inorganic phosphate transporter